MANSTARAWPSRSTTASSWRWLCRWSLVEPAVAVTWYAGLARGFEVPVSGTRALLLFSSLWLVYMADRLMDARTMSVAPLTERHRFARENSRSLGSLWLVVLVGALGLAALSLSRSEWRAGLSVVVAAVVYMVFVHLLPVSRLRLRQRGLKELGVALLFSIGSTLFIWSDLPVEAGSSSAWGLPTFALALLPFFLLVLQNLLHLARVERTTDFTHGTPSRAWSTGASRHLEVCLTSSLLASTAATGLLALTRPPMFDAAFVDVLLRVDLGAALGSSLLFAGEALVPVEHGDAHHLFADLAVLLAALPVMTASTGL